MVKKRFFYFICLFLIFSLISTNLCLAQNYNQATDKNLRTNSTVFSILDSVSISQLFKTEKHLTGEEPFLIDGRLDSIKTRYSYSTDIFKAQDYIRSRFESFGYPVELHSFPFGLFYDIKFSGNNYGWLVADGKLFGTNNGGQIWSTQYLTDQGTTFWSIFPVDSQQVFVVGSGGVILNSMDGGENWQIQPSPVSDFLFGVYFLNENLGWICGDNGKILKTVNSGTTWLQQNKFNAGRLYDIFFVTENLGWAVGRDGTIVHTIDSGNSWNIQDSNTANRLYGVYFLDENNGFVVGWNGTFLATTNAGATWSQISLPVGDHLYDIDFLNQTTGIIVGWNGTILKTINGGSNWNLTENDLNARIYGCDIVASAKVWAAGRLLVAKSENFGLSWQNHLDKIPLTNLNNIISTKNGITFPDQYYILCAHYDATSTNPAVSAPGADDNGSGTAAVIEAARVLKDYDFNYSIKFMLFPGEEQGLLGSNAYAAAARNRNDQILGVINMDMIAYDGNNDRVVEIHSGAMVNSQQLGNFVVSNISDWGLSLAPEFKDFNSSSASDHSSFWNFNYPAIMIIEDFEDFTPFYHYITDRLSTLNPSYYLETTKLAIGSLVLLAEGGTNSIKNPNLIPDNFILYNPYPNPFNSSVSIDYGLAVADKVELTVFDLLGKLMVVLTNTFQEEGNYYLSWDGRTDAGNYAPSGVYFVRLRTQNLNRLKKIVLMK